MNTTGNHSVLQEVIELDQSHFPDPWFRNQWEILDWNQYLLHTIAPQGKVIGFALFGVVPGDNTAHLYKILIHPDHRGSETSSGFWASILEKLKNSGITSIYLEVRASNSRAIKFYIKHGFKLLRRNKRFYSDGEDASIMFLTL